jgi:hypothetical protein
MLNENQENTSTELLERIIQKLRENPGVTGPSVNSSSGTWGSSGLRTKNKVFAMVSFKDRLVVKLPRERVKDLVACGVGAPLDPYQGWLLREWFVINPAYLEK